MMIMIRDYIWDKQKRHMQWYRISVLGLGKDWKI